MTPRPTITNLEPTRRPLSAAERRLLQMRRRDTLRRAEGYGKSLYLTAGGMGVLWVLTLLASDAVWWVITAFWVVVGTGMVLWMRQQGRAEGRYLIAIAERLDSASRRDEADVYTFTSRGYVEFEEIEDEGACYAFDLGDGRIGFVVGQEFYPEARFPSLDFSIVYPLDERGQSADLMIAKRGPKAAALRTIPAHVKASLEIPQHLEVVRGRLDGIESLLGAAATSGS